MKFGLFGSAQAKRGGPDMDSGQGFRDYIEYCVEAEALGYASTFAVEHHFTGFGQVSATINLLTWVAAKTTTLRLGTAVMVLPWHNPVLLAEQAATLDLLSGGRLDFGIGKGYRHNEFIGFCIPMEEADERFEEGLAVILKAWTSNDRFSHHGKHWHFEDVVVEPPTHQKPHPPIWMGAGSPGSIAKVAERGFKLLLDQYAPIATSIERRNFYKSEVEKRGRKFDPNDVALSRGFYVAKDEADKMQAIETRLAGQARTASLAQTPDKSNKATLLSYAHTAEASADAALYGSPDEISRKLELLRKAGFEQILLSGPAGSRENLRRFAREVMPAFVGKPKAQAAEVVTACSVSPLPACDERERTVTGATASVQSNHAVIPMKFAHFSHIWGKPGLSPHQRYEELWRELELCDELGFDYGFCVEHHFRPDESWMSSPSLYAVGAGARTKRIRLGPMGYIVPLYHPLRLAEEIALVDQMLGGRMELGLVPGINADYFRPFGLDYDQRKSPTLEFVDYLRAAYGDKQPFAYHGTDFHTDSARLAVQPAQKPHPPLWMMSRDPQTLEFCARNGVNPGYFLVYPRADAAPRYRKFLADWAAAGHPRKPNIGHCTVVYVDETDQKAIDTALFRASRAYEGFLAPAKPGESFDDRAKAHAQRFIGRGEGGAAVLMANLFNPDFIMEHELVFIGSPETVTKKLRAAAEKGVFNTFMGEFNFSDLPEADLMRSIRLFGEQVMPALRDYEPF